MWVSVLLCIDCYCNCIQVSVSWIFVRYCVLFTILSSSLRLLPLLLVLPTCRSCTWYPTEVHNWFWSWTVVLWGCWYTQHPHNTRRVNTTSKTSWHLLVLVTVTTKITDIFMMTYVHFCEYFERKELNIHVAKNVSKNHREKWNTHFVPNKLFPSALWFSG